jgi:hypothetical protein
MSARSETSGHRVDTRCRNASRERIRPASSRHGIRWIPTCLDPSKKAAASSSGSGSRSGPCQVRLASSRRRRRATTASAAASHVSTSSLTISFANRRSTSSEGSGRARNIRLSRGRPSSSAAGVRLTRRLPRPGYRPSAGHRPSGEPSCLEHHDSSANSRGSNLNRGHGRNKYCEWNSRLPKRLQKWHGECSRDLRSNGRIKGAGRLSGP